MPLRAYLAICLAPNRDYQRPLLRAIDLFSFASRPVTRRSAIQFGHALPRALAGPSVRRLYNCCLGSESDCVIVRNCLSHQGFTWSGRSTARSYEVVVSVEADRPRNERKAPRNVKPAAPESRHVEDVELVEVQLEPNRHDTVARAVGILAVVGAVRLAERLATNADAQFEEL